MTNEEVGVDSIEGEGEEERGILKLKMSQRCCVYMESYSVSNVGKICDCLICINSLYSHIQLRTYFLKHNTVLQN